MNNEILWTLLLDKAKRLASDRPELHRYLENILLDHRASRHVFEYDA